MSTPIDHGAAAIAFLTAQAEICAEAGKAEDALLDDVAQSLQTAIAAGQAATAHALLAIEARFGELVDQQRLSNVIAMITMLGPISEQKLFDDEAVIDAVAYVRDRAAGIVKPPVPGGESR